MVFPFWFIYNQGQLWFDISKGVTMRGAKAVINSTCHPCPVVDIKKVESRGNALAPNRRSSYLICSVVLYDKGGTNQRAGCLVTGCQIKMASKSRGSRPNGLTHAR